MGDVPIIDESEAEGSADLVAALTTRFALADDGLLRDATMGDEPHWLVPARAIKAWFARLEEQAGQSLGRRLAHAGAESEEYRLSLRGGVPGGLFFKRRKQLDWVNREWGLRGLGQLRVLSAADSEASLIVDGRTLTPLSAGMANAVWERLTGSRHRFRWEDQGADAALASLELDQRSIPAAEGASVPWIDAAGASRTSDVDHPLCHARRDEAGRWRVDGEVRLLLARDVLLRMDELVLPQLVETAAIQPWYDVGETDDLRQRLWCAHAEAARRQFVGSGELVLVAEAEHWMDVVRAQFTRHGLGGLAAVRSIDAHGGVELGLTSLFHPALCIGRLLGCWERAEGRPGRVSWRQVDDGGHTVSIMTRHELASTDTNDDP